VVSPASRRAVIAGAGAGIAAAFATGCGSGAATPRRRVPASQRTRDVQALNGLLDLVHPSIAAYEAGIPLLSGAVARAARQFLAEELEHAGRLQMLIHARHGRPRPPAAAYALGTPRTHRDVLALLHDSENREVAGLLGALPRVSQELRPQVASILANNAQHLAILRQALGRAPIPAPFLTAAE
jgi:hypothetical protein